METEIPIEKVPKHLEKRPGKLKIKRGIKTIQTTALLELTGKSQVDILLAALAYNCTLLATLVYNWLLWPKKKVTEWEIIKTEVGNEMEIFMTLTK